MRLWRAAVLSTRIGLGSRLQVLGSVRCVCTLQLSVARDGLRDIRRPVVW